MIFGIRKFHKYVYGRHFTLVTDHRPLTAILGPKSGIPVLAAARLQRWGLLLSAYHYEIEFRPTKAHANTDGLSRLPLPVEDSSRCSTVDSVFNIAQIQALPVSFSKLRKSTRTDPILSKVLLYVQRGWPDEIPEVLKPYWNRRLELTVERGCVLWGIRVIVPSKHRHDVLQMLHEGHAGIVRMKSIARSYVWWPGLDRDLDVLTKSCQPCQEMQNAPAVAHLHPWLWPSRPWAQVHIDFAGPFLNRMFLIIVDTHSKWPEVVEMKTTTAVQTIVELHKVFSVYGIPEQIVSDNGPQFVSAEFGEFCKVNDIKHIRVSPYHPSSNGLAERFVQTFKRAMKKGLKDGLPLEVRLASFLLTYCTTAHGTTDVPLCMLFMGHSLRTRLDILRPDSAARVLEKQAQQKEQHDAHACERKLGIGQAVMARAFSSSTRWLPGVVTRQIGPLTYLIQLTDGTVWRRHIDQL